MSNFSVKDGLYLVNFNSGKRELLNSYNNLPESLIFNIKYQYNSSSSGQIPRQGNNQQGHKLINHLSDQKHDILLIPFYGKYIQFNREFIEWFIGFTEGDGSLNITKGRSYFTIHLHNVDLPLLYKIKSELHMGSIYKRENFAIYQVRDRQNICVLISIFNNRLFLYKRKLQFDTWVKNY